MVTLVIHNLQGKDGNREYEGILTLEDVSPGDSVNSIFDRVENEGYRRPRLLAPSTPGSLLEDILPNELKSEDHPAIPISVVADESSDFKRRRINVRDRFIHFSSLKTPRELLKADLGNRTIDSATALVIDDSLEITFHRTLRLPDDSKIHSLPQSLGPFPLYNVDAFRSQLPSTIVDGGGIFFSMWQREAMWMEFQNRSSEKKYALRVFLGKVNVISGLTLHETTDKQDYIVVPGQPWIDGIVVAPGQVRQFVAMPVESGYTVEGQVTGEEKWGGIQIEVTPAYRSAAKHSYFIISPDGGKIHMTEWKTPQDYGLGEGVQVEMTPYPSSFWRPAQIRDYLRDDRQQESREDLQSIDLQAHNFEVQLHEWNSKDEAYMDSRAFRANGERPSFGASLVLASRKYTYRSKKKSWMPRTSTAPEVRQMGIAAGGKLIQDIYQDKYPSHIWDSGRARLVNVHILDSSIFEALTHIVPPMVPLTPQAYKEAGLPFYVLEEEIDNRIDGGQALKEVKSVSTMDKEVGVGSGSDTTGDTLRPKGCEICKVRLCDCIVRPCNHQFCNSCIKTVESTSHPGHRTAADPSTAVAADASGTTATTDWTCPTCLTPITRVTGFSAPMNLPGEETYKVDVPVRMLAIEDGRVEFRSTVPMRL